MNDADPPRHWPAWLPVLCLLAVAAFAGWFAGWLLVDWQL